MIHLSSLRWVSGALACAAIFSGCEDAPTGPPPGDVAAFNAKTEALKTAAADPKFDDFRAACDDYNSTRSKAAELEAKMHARTASPEEIKTWQELAPLIKSERGELLAYIQRDGFTPLDRNTMQWIMNAPASTRSGG